MLICLCVLSCMHASECFSRIGFSMGLVFRVQGLGISVRFCLCLCSTLVNRYLPVAGGCRGISRTGCWLCQSDQQQGASFLPVSELLSFCIRASFLPVSTTRKKEERKKLLSSLYQQQGASVFPVSDSSILTPHQPAALFHIPSRQHLPASPV